LEEAIELLIKTQYLFEIFQTIIHKTLEKIILKSKKIPPDKEDNSKMVFIENKMFK